MPHNWWSKTKPRVTLWADCPDVHLALEWPILGAVQTTEKQWLLSPKSLALPLKHHVSKSFRMPYVSISVSCLWHSVKSEMFNYFLWNPRHCYLLSSRLHSLSTFYVQGTTWDPEMSRQWSLFSRSPQLSGVRVLRDNETLKKAEDVSSA